MTSCGSQCMRRHLTTALDMANARADRWMKRYFEARDELEQLRKEMDDASE